ncbi:hypothetical protein C8J56DRAFT_1158238 [Mycena floridula]|nr:hypothetical protein C8J56DRAFT_1158238 [Mycena floridula]
MTTLFHRANSNIKELVDTFNAALMYPRSFFFENVELEISAFLSNGGEEKKITQMEYQTGSDGTINPALLALPKPHFTFECVDLDETDFEVAAMSFTGRSSTYDTESYLDSSSISTTKAPGGLHPFNLQYPPSPSLTRPSLSPSPLSSCTSSPHRSARQISLERPSSSFVKLELKQSGCDHSVISPKIEEPVLLDLPSLPRRKPGRPSKEQAAQIKLERAKLEVEEPQNPPSPRETKRSCDEDDYVPEQHDHDSYQPSISCPKKKKGGGRKRQNGRGRVRCAIRGCKTTFTREADRRRHLETAHAEPDTETIEQRLCEHCSPPKLYSRRDARQRHLREAHPEVLEITVA